jgi:ABC-type transport system involved in cytochrome c biogenesis ATPase subunit
MGHPASWNTARETGAFGFMGYPEVKRYAEIYDQQTFFTNQTERVTSAYTNSFSVLQIFDLDVKEAAATKQRDIDEAIQKVLAVQSELLVYDSVATELDKMYSKVLQQKF